MKVLYCPSCKGALKVIYSDQSFSGWKNCSCGEPVYVLASADGRTAAESLHNMLDNCRGDTAKMISFMLKSGEERRMEDISFVAGKATEPLIQQLGGLKVFDKIGYAYKINPVFKNYLEKYASSKAPKNRDIIEDFLNSG